ncbi:uncharacterized protein LOC130931246 isoform X2 [Corythoichthys intestinalis]|uniref:uncharacterized protein LOC130931246 isoform X2 n=1 Tax=Corythoichthys intestinalis TaxID=161448 RepID=UPI0025A627A2|nr:uncharacterized protein LOC130931246 isoform X2 [Corythoichthys intestinalis]
MAGHEWDDWFDREEFIGQISDMRVQNLQVEREVVQKRTFTRWMNLHLEKCNPPIEVQDLFQDIQDGHILMALLEELSGCKLLHGFKKSSHRIFRLNNIVKVLSFLEERKVKLVSIDAADVVDGNSSIILGLIWNIILFFQIKELTGNIRSQFPSTSSLASIPTSTDISKCNTSLAEKEMTTTARRVHSKAYKKLLQWVQKQTRKYGVAVQDFGKSWTSGLAFLAVIKSIDPSLVDMRKALLRSAQENLEDAFKIAHYSLGIPPLLESKDVTISAPDEQSIMTYVAQFLQHFPGMEERSEPYPIIQSSISMGRLNISELDTHVLGNGIHGNRVRERCMMFQAECAKAPPKRFPFVPADRRDSSPSILPWLSEDVLADFTSTEDNSRSANKNSEEPLDEVLTDITDNPLPLTHSDSLFDSSLPELIQSVSVMDDSAIGSPNSWAESEDGVIQVKSYESPSDCSLWDCDTSWSVHCTSHIEMTSVDGVSVPISRDVQVDRSNIDEGIYSLTPMEETQEKLLGEEKVDVTLRKETEVDFKNNSKDFLQTPLKEIKFNNENKEDQYQQMEKNDRSKEEEHPSIRETLFGANYQKSDDTNHSRSYPETELCFDRPRSDKFSVISSADEEQEYSKRVMDLVEDLQFDEKIVVDQPVEGVELENNLQKPKNDQTDFQYKQMDANSFVKIDVTLRDDSPAVHYDADTVVSCVDNDQMESDTHQAPCFTKIEQYSYQQPNCDEQSFFHQAMDNTMDSHVNERQIDCQISVNIDAEVEEEQEKTACPLADQREGENILCFEAVTKMQIKAIDAEKTDCPPLQPKLNSENKYEDFTSKQNTGSYPVNTKNMSSAVQAAKDQDDQQHNTFHSDKLGPREETSLTELLDSKTQSRQSVLSVAALEPVATETLPEAQPLNIMVEDVFVKLINEDKEKTAIKPETSDCKEEWQFRGGQLGGLKESVDCSNIIEAQQSKLCSSWRGTDSMRDGTKIPSQDKVLNPPVLRQRKGVFSQDNLSMMAAYSRQYKKNVECEFCWIDSWELYLLFLLWLLLYCFWLLPQMDLKTLLSLLFNNNH